MTQTFTAENTAEFIEIDGLSINIHRAGNGAETVVMLHGGGPGASGWGNFRDNLALFAESYSVLLIDTPHFGNSDKPVDHFLEVPFYADIVSKVLTKLGIAKAHFIGNSMGGTISLELALSHPEQVDRLVLMGTAGSLSMFAPQPTEGGAHLIGYYAGEGPTRQKMEAFIRSMVYDQTRISDTFLEERYQASIAPELMVHKQANFERMLTIWRDVHKIPHKTLLVHGRDDRVVPWDAGLLLLRLMPRADLHVFSRSGHWTQWERSPEFNAIVASFLSGPDT